MSVLGSEDEIEELGSELVDVAKVNTIFVWFELPRNTLLLLFALFWNNGALALQTEGFDGFTLELWSQLGGNKRK